MQDKDRERLVRSYSQIGIERDISGILGSRHKCTNHHPFFSHLTFTLPHSTLITMHVLWVTFLLTISNA